MPVDSELLKQIRSDDKNLKQLYLREELTLSEAKNLRTALLKNSQLEEVDISYVPLGDKKAGLLLEALAKHPNLQKLLLADTGITDDTVKEIAGCAHLKVLDVSANKLGIDSGRHIASLTKLEKLYIGENKLENEGAKALAAALHNLTELVISTNQITDEGVLAFATHARLRTLHVGSNQVGDKGVLAIAQNAALEELILSNNQITSIGAQGLAKNHNLKILNLWRNRIDDEGAIALATSSSLKKLNLNANQIGSQGAMAFLKNTALTTLQLNDNDIDEQTGALLKKYKNNVITVNVKAPIVQLLRKRASDSPIFSNQPSKKPSIRPGNKFALK